MMADDYISRQAALGCFHDWIDKYGDVHTADEMVEYQRIEALPSTQQESCEYYALCRHGRDEEKLRARLGLDDYISRQAAIDALLKHRDLSLEMLDDCGFTHGLEKASEIISGLPSAEKRGKWIKASQHGCVTYSDAYKECSHCHEAVYLGAFMDFCPNCGADMREEA